MPPRQEVPAGLNWDKWLGPLPETIYYNSDLNPVITLEPEQNEQLWGAWRWYKGMGGGLMTDWGAHMFDIAQWAMGKDRNGPVKIIPAGYGPYEHLTYFYDNGTRVTEQEFDGGKQGVKIYGENGDWIQVCRGEFLASDPKFMPEAKKKRATCPTKRKWVTIRLSSTRSARASTRTCRSKWDTARTRCAFWATSLTSWDGLSSGTQSSKFMHDPEADKLTHYQYRDGYKL
ncbi:MAG: hypothetical protein ACLR76_03135 [Alistipes sp.]